MSMPAVLRLALVSFVAHLLSPLVTLIVHTDQSVCIRRRCMVVTPSQLPCGRDLMRGHGLLQYGRIPGPLSFAVLARRARGALREFANAVQAIAPASAHAVAMLRRDLAHCPVRELQ